MAEGQGAELGHADLEPGHADLVDASAPTAVLPEAAVAGARGRSATGAFRGVPRAYFEEAAQIGSAVLADSAVSERVYGLGGLRCRVRYGDRAAEAAVHRALAHVEISPAGPPDLTIGVWDETQAARLLPEPHPHMLVDYRNHCLELCSDARYLALEERWLGTRSFIDRQAGVAWYCMRDARALPYYERAAPLRSLLNALLVGRGRHLVHAAAVGTSAGGVLLTGPPGAGKSSSALACLGGKLGFVADDWCGVTAGPGPRIFSVYASAKLRIDGLDRFPEMRERIDNFDRLDEEKATAFLSEHWRSGLLADCPVKAIFIPEVAGGARTAVVPTSGKEAWRAMTSWTLKQLTGCGRDSIALLTRFAASLPAFRLRLGGDRHEVRAALEEALARL